MIEPSCWFQKCNRNSGHRCLYNGLPDILGGLLFSYLHPPLWADEVSDGLTLCESLMRFSSHSFTLCHLQRVVVEFSLQSHRYVLLLCYFCFRYLLPFSFSLWSRSECNLCLNVMLFDWGVPVISIPWRPIALSQPQTWHGSRPEVQYMGGLIYWNNALFSVK